jgi:3-isopropylmalate dehydrogenase
MKIAVLPGDGIGPEVTHEAVRVIEALGLRDIAMEQAPVGGAAYKAHGHPAPATLEIARQSDAILFGAVGDPDCDALDRHLRPEQAILGLRKELTLFANLRPAKVFKGLEDHSALPRSRFRHRSADRARTQRRRLFRRKGLPHHRQRRTRRL